MLGSPAMGLLDGFGNPWHVLFMRGSGSPLTDLLEEFGICCCGFITGV